MLNKIAADIYQQNKEKGFWDKERNIGELLMLITSELAEAMEAHRGRKNILNREAFEKNEEEDFNYAFNTFVKDSFEDELADAAIRLFDAFGGLGIDMDFHIENKLKYNKSRARLHGKKY